MNHHIKYLSLCNVFWHCVLAISRRERSPCKQYQLAICLHAFFSGQRWVLAVLVVAILRSISVSFLKSWSSECNPSVLCMQHSQVSFQACKDPRLAKNYDYFIDSLEAQSVKQFISTYEFIPCWLHFSLFDVALFKMGYYKRKTFYPKLYYIQHRFYFFIFQVKMYSV